LANFKANTLRKSAVMLGMAATLSPEDMSNVSAYYAAQKPKDGAARNADTAALGRKIFRGGDVAKGLAACASCHGATGAGIPSQYPRLAGQHAEYTEAQLKAFRSGERANDSNRMMRMVAEKMSDAEIKAVSDYIAGLR
jgi:cytochrome c553